MITKGLIEKVIGAECLEEEMSQVLNFLQNRKNYEGLEFLKNSFEKYYNLARIINTIRKYENKEIDDRCLAHWMCVYNWIIMADEWANVPIEEITFKTWIVWEISGWLDSLSFFDDSDDFYNLEEYKKTFEVLDKIYNNLEGWNRVFAHTDEWGDNDDDVVVLVSNDKTKEFVRIGSQLDYLNNKVAFERVELDELKRRVDALKKLDYKELEYGVWHDE